MFEIRCLVGDKKIAEVLNLLDGYTLEPPVVVPIKDVANPAVGANGHSHPSQGHKNGNAVNSLELLRKFIKGRKLVTAREMRETCVANGFSKNGYSYALNQLQKEKLLRKAKEAFTYEVTANG